MEKRNWNVRIKALFLAAIMMFALAASAFAGEARFIWNVGSSKGNTVYVYAQKGQTVTITNCGNRNLQVYNGIVADAVLAPGQYSYYKAQKTGTYKFAFQTAWGGSGSTTNVNISTTGRFT